MKKQIPNLITLCNLLCGVLSVWSATSDTPVLGMPPLTAAAGFIMLGIFFDFFDGMTARLLGVASPVGKELDSLADVITSGIAPAFILFYILVGHPMAWLKFIAFLIPAFAAYRLAKFNLDERQHHSFLGLPAPANALIWAGLGICYDLNTPAVFEGSWLIIWAILSLNTGFLMISEMPMFSLKFNFRKMDWKTNKTQYCFLIGCLILILTFRIFALPLIILWYAIMSRLCCRKEESHE